MDRACRLPTVALSYPRSGAACRVAGFTLVELMVVMVVVALAGGAVLLTAPGAEDALDQDSQRLAIQLTRARDEAILSNRAIEVTVTAQGYAIARQDFGQWQPLREPPFGNVLWQSGTQPRLPTGREQMLFRFDVTGGATPADVRLHNGNRQARISVAGNGQVQVDAR